MSQGTGEFAVRLRRLREAAGLTQEELAERAGLTAKAIGALEQGRRQRPYPHTVRALADGLNLSDEDRAALIEAGRRRAPSGSIDGGPPPPSALLLPPTPLIGRERELAEIAQLLGQGVRLLTLIGPGGVGKTRLAIAVAAQLGAGYPDGAVFVPLAPLSDPALVLPTIAEALGVKGATGRSLPETLGAQLAGQRRLVVLDNMEHVLTAGPEIGTLLAVWPGLTVLATSRAPLRLRGEREYPLAPLALPDLSRVPTMDDVANGEAVQLFVARAQEVAPGFALTQSNAAAIGAICRRLDGLPLALELAAAWVKLLPPIALLARLDRALPLLGAGARDLPERQQTMARTIAWSHDLLAPAEQVLFRRLAVFAGGWTLEAADFVHQSVEEPEGQGRSCLGSIAMLVDHSLIRTGGPIDGVEAEPRFAMLETIREYAFERLELSGEAATIRDMHAAWCAALAEQAALALGFVDRDRWSSRLDDEHDNLRAALTWLEACGDYQGLLRLAGCLWQFWFRSGYIGEGRSWLARALAYSEGSSATDRARGLLGAGALATVQGDFEQAIAQLESALALFEELGLHAEAAVCLFFLGVVAQDEGDPATAARHLEQALALSREAGDEGWTGATLNNLGLVLARAGDPERGQVLLEEALARHRVTGFAQGTRTALRYLAQVVYQRGDAQRAGTLYRESLAIGWEQADKWHVASSVEGLAAVAASAGQLDRAARLLGAAAALREQFTVPLEPAKQAEHERIMASARTALGEQEFARLWQEGQALSPADAVTLAIAAAPDETTSDTFETEQEPAATEFPVRPQTMNPLPQ